MVFIDFQDLEVSEETIEKLFQENNQNIESIYIDGKNLRELSNQFSIVTTTLKNLNLSFNNFEVIPTVIFDCIGLEYLDLHSNEIREVPTTIQKLSKLKFLSLANNQIKEISFAISVPNLDVSGNQLTEIDPLLLGSNSLKSLNLSRNQISSIPTISHCDIESLQLAQNQLQVIHSFSAFQSLELLDLSQNRISLVRKHGFESLFTLKTLYLNENPLTTLPDFADLISLQLLDISGTLISKIHPSVGGLAHLAHLRMSTPLPQDSLFELQSDSCKFQQFQYPPPDICAKGLSEIASYIKSDRAASLHI
jgi:Leucine-rich repeat (LRR) protein